MQLGDVVATTPLVKITRGNVTETVHRGALAVVDNEGHLIAHAGDPDLIVCMRSSAKPFQLLPLVESGAADRLGFGEREMAVMAASHNGSADHVKAVAGILDHLGLDESALLCGAHPPIDRQAANALIRAEAPPSPLQHNCSGKHAGMLAYAVSQEWPVEDYINPSHPLQVNILQTLAEMTDWPAERIRVGVDGCSVPVFGLPLRRAALAYARLADPSGLPPTRQAACRRIVAAMTHYPDMVAGEGRFDTALMRAGQGRIVAKGGAAGYQGVGVLPEISSHTRPGAALGLALKIEDGDGRLSRPLAALEALRQLGVLERLKEDRLAMLTDFGPRAMLNYRQIPVGEIAPAFELKILTAEPVL